MKIERFGPGERKCQAVVHGDTIYLAGQIGEGDGIAEQTGNALAEVDRLLALTGGSKDSILSVTVWLASMDDFDGMNEVYDAWIDPAHQPVRACGESRLGSPEFLVEFIVIAARQSS